MRSITLRPAGRITLFNELHAQRPDLVARLFEPFKLDGRGERPPGSKRYSEIPRAATPKGN